MYCKVQALFYVPYLRVWSNFLKGKGKERPWVRIPQTLPIPSCFHGSLERSQNWLAVLFSIHQDRERESSYLGSEMAGNTTRSLML